MNLHSDKEAFKEIIALAAEHFGYEQSHVEKDYWVSKILRDISMSEYADKTYFKGGTSLSKAYGLIERFSEVWTCSCSRVTKVRPSRRKRH